jgi:hypothetical protein
MAVAAWRWVASVHSRCFKWLTLELPLSDKCDDVAGRTRAVLLDDQPPAKHADMSNACASKHACCAARICCVGCSVCQTAVAHCYDSLDGVDGALS